MRDSTGFPGIHRTQGWRKGPSRRSARPWAVSHAGGHRDPTDGTPCAWLSHRTSPNIRGRLSLPRAAPPRLPAPAARRLNPSTWAIWARGERANFTRLVLGCIEAKFCKEMLVGKLSPRSTQCTLLHSSAISFFFAKICQNVAEFCRMQI